MDINYVKIVSEVVLACAEKYSDINRVNETVKEDFSDSWMCNMYMDYMNNYLTTSVFFDSEISHILPEYADRHFSHAIKVCESLLSLFRSTGILQPMLSHEQIGFIVERVLKGQI